MKTVGHKKLLEKELIRMANACDDVTHATAKTQKGVAKNTGRESGDGWEKKDF